MTITKNTRTRTAKQSGAIYTYADTAGKIINPGSKIGYSVCGFKFSGTVKTIRPGKTKKSVNILLTTGQKVEIEAMPPRNSVIICAVKVSLGKAA